MRHKCPGKDEGGTGTARRVTKALQPVMYMYIAVYTEGVADEIQCVWGELDPSIKQTLSCIDYRNESAPVPVLTLTLTLNRIKLWLLMASFHDVGRVVGKALPSALLPLITVIEFAATGVTFSLL